MRPETVLHGVGQPSVPIYAPTRCQGRLETIFAHTVHFCSVSWAKEALPAPPWWTEPEIEYFGGDLLGIFEWKSPVGKRRIWQ
jgi:hypothetical protein